MHEVGLHRRLLRDIRARVFDHYGNPRTPEFTLSGEHSAARRAPHVVHVDGGFYAVWMEDTGPPAPGGERPHTWCIKGQRWALED